MYSTECLQITSQTTNDNNLVNINIINLANLIFERTTHHSLHHLKETSMLNCVSKDEFRPCKLILLDVMRPNVVVLTYGVISVMHFK